MTILCVDDHPVMLDGLIKDVQSILPQARVLGFTKANEALAFAEEHGCDVLFCEIELYHHGGLLLAEQLRRRFPRVNIIFVTVCSENEHAREVLRLRPSGYLIKPATREQVAEELRNLRYPVTERGFARRRKRVCGA